MSTGLRTMRSEYLHWAKNQPPARFNLASSEVAHFPLDRLSITIADLELDGASYYRYPPLRQAIARKCGVAPECVVAVDGTSMANLLAMAALIAPGDEVTIETPTYEPVLAAAQFLGARITPIERQANAGFRLDPAEVERILSPRTKLIVLTNPHNPSGLLADEDVLRDIGDLVERRGARVLIDEIFLDAASPPPRTALHLGAQFVCTGSLTKVYGLSGLRCGWILAEPELAERMWRLNDLFGVSQAHPAERLACIAFANLDEIAAGTSELLERNRGLFNAFAGTRDDLECLAATDGITAFPRWRGGDIDPLHALLRDRHDTSIVPGCWFGMPDHFRIGLGSTTEVFEAGLERIGAALDMLR